MPKSRDPSFDHVCANQWSSESRRCCFPSGETSTNPCSVSHVIQSLVGDHDATAFGTPSLRRMMGASPLPTRTLASVDWRSVHWVYAIHWPSGDHVGAP